MLASPSALKEERQDRQPKLTTNGINTSFPSCPLSPVLLKVMVIGANQLLLPPPMGPILKQGLLQVYTPPFLQHLLGHEDHCGRSNEGIFDQQLPGALSVESFTHQVSWAGLHTQEAQLALPETCAQTTLFITSLFLLWRLRPTTWVAM